MKSDLRLDDSLQVVLETLEQLKEKDNWTNQKVGCQTGNQLPKAAASYALPLRDRTTYGNYKTKPVKFPEGFPWKPSPENRIREVAISAAYCLMEIQRLLNQTESEQTRNY